MSNKINIRHVIFDHIATLKDASTNKVSIIDLITFFFVPAALSTLAVYSGAKLTADSNSLLMNFAAIFTALLVSVLVLIYDQTEKNTPKENPTEFEALKLEILKELHINVCYTITASAFLIILSLLTSLTINSSYTHSDTINWLILTPISIFLVANIVLTILMIIKRVGSLSPR